MRKVVLQIICCLLALNVQAQKNIELFSPDGNIKLALNKYLIPFPVKM